MWNTALGKQDERTDERTNERMDSLLKLAEFYPAAKNRKALISLYLLWSSQEFGNSFQL